MTTNGPDDIRQLLPSYVLGALEKDERARVEEHLESVAGSEEGAELDRELLALTAQLEALADELPPVAPAETTRARLLLRIENAAQATTSAPPFEREPSHSFPAWAAAAALFLVAVTLGWQNYTQRGVIADLAAGGERLETEVAALRAELGQARTTAARLAAAQRIVAAPDADRILLAGLEQAPEASANLYHDGRAGRAVFYVADLPRLADDRDYQLWFIGGDGPVSGGTFDVDERGEASLVVDDVLPPDQIAVWAVTVEPSGGVPQPTGPMVLKS